MLPDLGINVAVKTQKFSDNYQKYTNYVTSAAL